MSQLASVGLKKGLLIGLVSGIIVAAAVVGLFLASSTSAGIRYSPAAHTREFYLFTSIVEFNETEFGIPHDIFSAKAIEVNQGDTVVIHFINTEPISSQEHHTFTLPAYNVDVDLGPGQKQDIKFTATQAGIFEFVCKFHLPTMQGELIVLPTA